MGYRDEHRQLAAIMFTDIVGFTALMSESEASALRALKRSRRLVRRLTRRYKGRWLETVGDGNLISFASATDAVNCALTIQQNLHKDADLSLRIGIHVGDIIDAGGHIYGDGVNVASRIHELAEPGGIVVSEPVYDAVRNKSGINTEKLGVRDLEGLDHPIQVYSLAGEAVDAPLLGAIDQPGRRRWVLAFTAVALAMAAVLSAGIYSRYGDVHAGNASVAVLPFEDLSPDSTNRYFSVGISEELINKLSRVPGLRVAGRSSSFAYGDRDLNVRKLGDVLNVSHVLEGSVRKAGNRVKISAQLVNTDTGFQIWAESYEAQFDDIFKVQQDISQSIVEALRLKLMPRELENVGKISTRDAKAYDLYLQGRSALREAITREDHDEAISLLERALRHDPTFAEAEAARCEALVGKYEQTRDPTVMDDAIKPCNRALMMDPEAPQAHIALGSLYLATGRPSFAVESFARALPLDSDNVEIYLGLAKAFVDQGRVEDAEKYYEHAIELKPKDDVIFQNYAWAMYKYGRYDKAIALMKKAIGFKPDEAKYYSDLGALLYSAGRFKEASDAFLKAHEIEPYDRAYNNAGTMSFFAGDYDAAVEMFRKAVEITPDDPRFVAALADACRMARDCKDWKGIYERALDLADARLRVNPEDVEVVSLKGVLNVFLGREQQAVEAIEQAVTLGPEDPGVLANAAIVWSRLGDKEKAREYVEKARSFGYPDAILKAHPDILVASAEVTNN